MAASKRPTLGFFQVLDQGAKHESPFTVFFGGSFFSKHILPPHPPKWWSLKEPFFFRKHFTTKYTGEKKQHHFQKCEPWRLLTKFICGELTLLRNDTSSSPLRSSHWGCRGHPPSWRLRIPKVLRRWEKHYSIIHFRRMIDVKICLQNLTKHWHRFRCQMAYIIYLNTYGISCRWHIYGISICIHNYELDCVLQQYHAPIPSTIGAHDIARVQCYLKHGINGVLHRLAVY